jgi:integrase
LDGRLDLMSCAQVAEFVKGHDRDIDFIAFGKAHNAQLVTDNKKGTSIPFRAVVNSLVDFFGREKVYISEINSNMLREYEKYLRSTRKITRLTRTKKEFTITSPGLSDGGLHNHMRDLRGLFNLARNKFNDEDLGIIRIPHYPFKKYKIIDRPETAKRNLSIVQLLAIRDCQCIPGSREELARDLFMLSFYLCGTNSVDLYQLRQENIRNGRIEYNRSKTKGKRKDKAFISMNISAEAEPLLNKYVGKLEARFSTRIGFSSALSYGLRQLQKTESIPGVTFYWGRHSFATLARNKCRKSKDDVAMALNHIDENRKTTDIYIAKDWSIVDEVQEAVTALLRKNTDNPEIEFPEQEKLPNVQMNEKPFKYVYQYVN